MIEPHYCDLCGCVCVACAQCGGCDDCELLHPELYSDLDIVDPDLLREYENPFTEALLDSWNL